MIVSTTPRVVAIIQARTGSSRFPEKVLHKLADRTVLEWCVRAAKAAVGVDAVVIATTTAPADDRLVEIAERAGVGTFRGSEEDVLSRFVGAAEAADADAVLRLTSDCPLLDPVLISQVVSIWRANPVLQYVSTTLSRSFPRGLDVELASVQALKAVSETAEGHHRTHVTSALYEAGSSYQRLGLSTEPNLSHLRVTLDTIEDAQALDELVPFLHQVPPSWTQVAEVLDAHPHIRRLNDHVRQKRLDEG